MKTIKTLIVLVLMLVGMTATAQNTLTVKSGNEKAELQLSNEPVMTISDKVTVKTNTTTLTFGTDQRVVLYTKDFRTNTEKADVSGDGKVSIEDVSQLVNLLLSRGTYSLGLADFYNWTAADATGEKVSQTECAYKLNVSTSVPYGDVNVYYLNYADLSAYTSLIIVATEGEPYVIFNRTVDKGAVGVAIPRDKDTYETVVDNGDGSKTYTIDLAKIVANQGFAHLHAIKGANFQNTTVTSIMVDR